MYSARYADNVELIDDVWYEIVDKERVEDHDGPHSTRRCLSSGGCKPATKPQALWYRWRRPFSYRQHQA